MRPSPTCHPNCRQALMLIVAVHGTAGRLVGHLYFHMGDDPGFVCEPW